MIPEEEDEEKKECAEVAECNHSFTRGDESRGSLVCRGKRYISTHVDRIIHERGSYKFTTLELHSWNVLSANQRGLFLSRRRILVHGNLTRFFFLVFFFFIVPRALSNKDAFEGRQSRRIEQCEKK